MKKEFIDLNGLRSGEFSDTASTIAICLLKPALTVQSDFAKNLLTISQTTSARAINQNPTKK